MSERPYPVLAGRNGVKTVIDALVTFDKIHNLTATELSVFDFFGVP